MIKAIQAKNSLWSSQANAALRMFQNLDQYERMVCNVMTKLQDRHNRFMFIEAYKDMGCMMLSRIHKKLGQAMNFNFWNPSGHYHLNIGVPEQRDVAKILLLLNKQVYNKIVAGELKDRSQFGNKSYMRNEKLNGGPF